MPKRIDWEVLETRENDTFIVMLKRHETEGAEFPPYRITVTRKDTAGATEHQGVEDRDEAVALYDEYLSALGFLEVAVLPPETPEQTFSTWWMRLHQTKQIARLQQAEEQAMADDPDVNAYAASLVRLSYDLGGWPSAVIRAICTDLVEAQRQRELEAVKVVPGFGRFG